MRARKLAVACLIAGSAVAVTGGPAAASEATTQGAWMVYASYPNTLQGWRDCGNASVNVYKGHCKLNSDTSNSVDLWGWRS
ncbi:hypothetical protein [Allokutzneria oryzae]|uniref:Uncharacterized protein n=1 Tax=Allokutzneria oryzae TaxID=1378989 RepID=A0ABV6A0X9_9PSEU